MNDPGQLAKDLLQKHFPKFGTFRQACAYAEHGEPVYDANSGLNTRTVLSTTSIEIIFADISEANKGVMMVSNVPVESRDRQAIFPSADLGFDPKVADSIFDASNVEWMVMAIGSDPKPAIFQLHVRPIDG